jgi:hypothetical protein
MRSIAILTVALVSTLAIQAEAAAEKDPNAPLAGVKAVEVALLDKLIWSDPMEVKGIKCRAVIAGKTGGLPFIAWWEKNRPAPNTYYKAVVSYCDTATTPATFYVYGGLATLGAPSDIFCFGGSGDGQWKTVEIPVSWDYLLAKSGTRNGEVAFSADKDLPIEKVEFFPIPDADVNAARLKYNADIRAYVAKVQATRTDKKTRFNPQDEKPMQPQGMGPIVPFVRSYLQVVFPYSAPQQDEAKKPLSVKLAQGEYEPATFGIYANGAVLHNVKAEVSGLDPVKGWAAKVLTAEYALVQKDGGLAEFPQRLWPDYPVDIQSGRSCWFWVIAKAPDKATPGAYSAEVSVTADEGKTTIPMKIEVLPFKLPAMDEAGLTMGGCTTGLPSFHEIDELVRHNHNDVNIWFHGIRPEFTGNTPNFNLDFYTMDDWMQEAKKRGISSVVWFLGGNPYSFPRTMTIEREVWKHYVKTTDARAAAMTNTQLNDEWAKFAVQKKEDVPEVIKPLYARWVKLVWDHATSSGWPEVILTPFDEPAKWSQNRDSTGPFIKPHFENACNLIHQVVPKCKVYGSIHHAKPGIVFLPVIDVFCTNAIQEDETLGDQVRAAKKIFWQYAGTDSAGLPTRARYSFGFFFQAYESMGSLCWAYNWDTGWDTTKGDNWSYAWDTPFETISSPFYEGMREAWDDRRYVAVLKAEAKKNKVDVAPFLKELYTQAKAQRDAGGRDTVSDFYAETKSAQALDDLRNKVIARILEIQAKKKP